jgi:hypothetical protein
MADVEIVKGYIPGSIGRVAELHGTYPYNDDFINLWLRYDT